MATVCGCGDSAAAGVNETVVMAMYCSSCTIYGYGDADVTIGMGLR
jgi:hypothetical protein